MLLYVYEGIHELGMLWSEIVGKCLTVLLRIRLLSSSISMSMQKTRKCYSITILLPVMKISEEMSVVIV